MPKIVAITIGDINGIGIEILINSWKKNKIKNFILFTDITKLKRFIKKKNINLKINIVKKENNKIRLDYNKINIFSYNSKSNEDNTFKSLKFAYEFCIKKICIGIITLPLRKDLIKKKITRKFIGHTEFFQEINNKKYSNMILFHNKIIISTITTHIELKKVSKIISNKVFLNNQICNLNKTLKIDFNIAKPKIIISGLNPHAGENGELGYEEIKIIIPIVKKLKKLGISIHGPVSADSMLVGKNINKYDCFIYLYHDQALIPFKYISKFTGVNYTGNLDIIRTSPDHGTAYNLRGSKNISDNSFLNCYKLIKKIYKNRIINAKS